VDLISRLSRLGQQAAGAKPADRVATRA
jgi:hypothetical protein